MKDEDIHVGDVVRIRSFEDMKSEFGIDEDGDIHGGCSAWFYNEMKPLCGKVFTVSEFEYDEYHSVEGIEDCDDGTQWSISAWMLEPYNDDKDIDVASDEELNLLFY